MQSDREPATFAAKAEKLRPTDEGKPPRQIYQFVRIASFAKQQRR